MGSASSFETHRFAMLLRMRADEVVAHSYGKNSLDVPDRRGLSPVRYMLGALMTDSNRTGPVLLDAVALLRDVPAHKLARGQVGTVVENLDDRTALIEFGDDDGRAYAIVPLPRSDLLVLHYVPHAA